MDSFISKLVDQYSQLAELQIHVFSFNMCEQQIALDANLFIEDGNSISVILLQNYNKAALDELLQRREMLVSYSAYYSVVSNKHFILVFSNAHIELPQFLYTNDSLFLSFRTYSTPFLVVSTLNLNEIPHASVQIAFDAISEATHLKQISDVENIIVGTTVRENTDFTETYLLQEPPANFKPTGIFLSPRCYNAAFPRFYPSKILVSNHFKTLSYASTELYSRFQAVRLSLNLQTKLVNEARMSALITEHIAQWTREIRYQMAKCRLQPVLFSGVELNQDFCEEIVVDADTLVQISFTVPNYMQRFLRVEFARRRLNKAGYRVHLRLTEEYIQQMQKRAFECVTFDVIARLSRRIPEITNSTVTFYATLSVRISAARRPYGLSFATLCGLDAGNVLFGRSLQLSGSVFAGADGHNNDGNTASPYNDIRHFPELILTIFSAIDPVAYALNQDARNQENVANFVRLTRFGGRALTACDFSTAQQLMKERAGSLDYIVKMLAFKFFNEAYCLCKNNQTRVQITSYTAESVFNGTDKKSLDCARYWLETDWRVKMRYFV